MAKFIKQQSVLIIFTDAHLAYSPTTLNLFYTLKENYKVKLLSAKPSAAFSDNVIVDPDIAYIELKRDIRNVLRDIFYRVFDLFIKPSENTLSLRSLFNSNTKAIISFIKKTDADIIAVDSLALWCVQQANRRADLLSLEIGHNENYLKHTRFSTIKSVIIQSEERLDYLFPDKKPKYFIVQNAPRNTNFIPLYGERKKTDLIYCGSAVSAFGIISCFDFIKDNSEYTLTVKGAFPKETERVAKEFYSDLIAEKRLIIDSDYLTATDLTNYVSKFRIGLAFYDFYRFGHLMTFNYFTAPSGKVYQYLNGGVPVIANVLPGFEFIRENNCGKLITHLSSQQIKLAINAIEDDYLTIAQNAKMLSAKYDFEKMIQPFLAYFKNEGNDADSCQV